MRFTYSANTPTHVHIIVNQPHFGCLQWLSLLAALPPLFASEWWKKTKQINTQDFCVYLDTEDACKQILWVANGLKVSNRTTQRPSPEYKSNWPRFRVHTVAFNLLAALKSTYITIPDKVISVAYFIMYFQFLLSLFQSSHIWTRKDRRSLSPQNHRPNIYYYRGR